MKKALAIDVGGTKIYSTVINENGEIIGDIEKHSTPKVYSEIISTFKNIISKHENEIDIVAFSTCGAVNNQNTGILGSTGNIAKEYPTTDFQSLSSKPVFVENDANCAAWAEYEIGSAKGCLNSVMLTLGTGVGGGIIVNGQLLKGKNGAAGEMHFKLRTDKRRKCTCGAWDCFEIYCSGTGLKLTGEEVSGNSNITTYDIIAGYKSGDEIMTKIFDIWQDDILAGCIGLANIFDPDCIVLSGSMAEFVDIEYLTKETNREIVTTPTKVVKASAGNYSGMIGAALLAFRKGF
ncbi:MAG: ROK family protein [Cyanobacteria bacterium SIG32]|nr:ROK family protein [Cyanobacteria bacterium SIG32]